LGEGKSFCWLAEDFHLEDLAPNFKETWCMAKAVGGLIGISARFIRKFFARKFAMWRYSPA
jgi:hypothetical protein